MFMEQDLSSSDQNLAKCTLPATDCPDSIFVMLMEGKDHTNFLILLSVFMSTICVLFFFAFKTKFRRSQADQSESSNQSNENS